MAAFKWVILLFHVTLMEVTQGYSDGRWAGMEGPKPIPVAWCFIGSGRKANLSWNHQLEFFHVASPAWQPLQCSGTSYSVPQSFWSKPSSFHLLTGGRKRICGPGLKMPKLGEMIINIFFFVSKGSVSKAIIKT